MMLCIGEGAKRATLVKEGLQGFKSNFYRGFKTNFYYLIFKLLVLAVKFVAKIV